MVDLKKSQKPYRSCYRKVLTRDGPPGIMSTENQNLNKNLAELHREENISFAQIVAGCINDLVVLKVLSAVKVSKASNDTLEEFIDRFSNQLKSYQPGEEIPEKRIQKIFGDVQIAKIQALFGNNIPQVEFTEPLEYGKTREQSIQFLEKLLAKVKEKYPTLEGFLAFGSRIDVEKDSDEYSDLDIIAIFSHKKGFPTNNVMGIFLFQRVLDNVNSENFDIGYEISLCNILHTDRFLKLMKNESGDENGMKDYWWGWTPQGVCFVGNISELSQEVINKRMQEFLSSSKIIARKDYEIAKIRDFITDF